MGLEIRKMLCAKPRVSFERELRDAIIMLTQPGHVDERLKTQKEENRTCLLRIVQSITYHSRQGKQDEELNFKQILLRAEND